MEKIYTTQDYLRIELYFEEGIENNILSSKIKYIDPNGTIGEWNASLDAENKKIYYDLPKGSPLGIAGKWTVWSVVTMLDGRIMPGSKSYFTVVDDENINNNCYTGNCY